MQEKPQDQPVVQEEAAQQAAAAAQEAQTPVAAPETAEATTTLSAEAQEQLLQISRARAQEVGEGLAHSAIARLTSSAMFTAGQKALADKYRHRKS